MTGGVRWSPVGKRWTTISIFLIKFIEIEKGKKGKREFLSSEKKKKKTKEKRERERDRERQSKNRKVTMATLANDKASNFVFSLSLSSIMEQLQLHLGTRSLSRRAAGHATPRHATQHSVLHHLLLLLLANKMWTVGQFTLQPTVNKNNETIGGWRGMRSEISIQGNQRDGKRKPFAFF